MNKDRAVVQWSATRRPCPDVAPRGCPESPGLRKPRKIAEDSGRSLSRRQAFVIAQEIRDRGTPETPEADFNAVGDLVAAADPRCVSDDSAGRVRAPT